MVPVYDNLFTEEDAQAAANAVRSGILSSFGPEVTHLEKRFAQHVRTQYALSCTSGTTALFLAMLACEEQLGQLVVAVPTCSYAATAFAVEHINGEVVFVDSDLDTWNLDLNSLDKICEQRTVNPINVVLAVHNYGNPVDMEHLMALSMKHGFIVIEDACEAFTSTYKGQQLGSIGHIGVFSFYGNKLLSSGEGGMVVTNTQTYYDHMKLQRGQGQDPNRRFWHLLQGWNFRLTNLQAAVINSQFNRLPETIAKKKAIYEYYRDHLNSDLIWQKVPQGGESCWWMVSIRHWEDKWYQKASQYLTQHGVETRPIFPPIHKMPAMPLHNELTFPNAELLVDSGITLPSGPQLTLEQLQTITRVVNAIV
jgi:perosamine synthetase